MTITIAGAGIAGLSAALALAQRGIDVQVFERAPVLQEVGAGIQLSPNAMAVLDRLGIGEAVTAKGSEPEAIIVFEGRSHRELTRIPLGPSARERYGHPYVVVHRADLLDCLHDAILQTPGIELRLGSQIHSVSQTDDRVEYLVGQTRHTSEVLLSAEGINSRVRTGLLACSGPQSTGYIAWRATIATSNIPDVFPPNATAIWFGPDVHLVHYPLKCGERTNIVVVSKSALEGSNPPLKRFHDAGRKVMERVDDWVLWPLRTVDPDCAWSKGRVALLGDAAHAMVPSAAQGGAQALEDGWVLSKCLAEEKHPQLALSNYESERKSRVLRITNEANRNLQIYGMRGPVAAARNLTLSAMPRRLLLSRLDWLFGAQPA